jgi:hypothetical protein
MGAGQRTAALIAADLGDRGDVEGMVEPPVAPA